MCDQGTTASAEDGGAGGDIFVTPPNDAFPYNAVYSSLSNPVTREKGNASEEETLPAHSIRLLRLFPGSGEDPISCELIQRVSLSSSGETPHLKYEAVSYAAGDPLDSAPIVLNGYPFNIFRNLSSALKQFRRTTNERILWVDQICINQTDIAERDSQVLLMRKIYEQAHCTLAWLGEADDETDLAFDLLDEFLSKHGDRLRHHIHRYGESNDSVAPNEKGKVRPINEIADFLRCQYQWYFDTWSTLFERDERYSKVDDHNSKPILEACLWMNDVYQSNPRSSISLQSILNRPWWSRCWILQEVIVSNDVTVYCGPRFIGWNDLGLLILIDVFSIFTKYQANRLREYNESILSCYSLVMMRTGFLYQSIVQILHTCRRSLASDPRDKVYSILGLFNQEKLYSYNIRPSYLSSTRVEEVFTAAAKAGIQVDRKWPFDLINGKELEHGLPSWCPDWRTRKRNGIGLSANFQAWNAGGLFDELHSPQFLNKDRAMRLDGLPIGIVDVLGKAHLEDTDVSEALASWRTILSDKAIQRGQSFAQLLEPFVRTLYQDSQPFSDVPCSNQGYSNGAILSYWEQKLVEIRDSYIIYTRPCGASRFFMLRDCYPGLEHQGIGLVSWDSRKGARAGDEVYVLIGCPKPVILRKCEQAIAYEGSNPNISQYHFVEVCYVQGAMKGEIMEQLALMRQQSDGEDLGPLTTIDLI